MASNRVPLSYAIMKLFESGRILCARDVTRELKSTYSDHKMLNMKNVEETLSTARENGLLEEAKAEMSTEGHLQIFFKLSDYGAEMVSRYL